MEKETFELTAEVDYNTDENCLYKGKKKFATLIDCSIPDTAELVMRYNAYNELMANNAELVGLLERRRQWRYRTAMAKGILINDGAYFRKIQSLEVKRITHDALLTKVCKPKNPLLHFLRSVSELFSSDTQGQKKLHSGFL